MRDRLSVFGFTVRLLKVAFLCSASALFLFTAPGAEAWADANARRSAQSRDKVDPKASVGRALSKVAKALRSKGISKVPSTSNLVDSGTSSSALARLIRAYVQPQTDLYQSVVSGTPPKLVDIPSISVKDLFWLSGVVDAIASGSASQSQCRQFFSSTTDGDSGGLGACQMAEGVGHSFEALLNAETSLCFMKNMPTKANLRAGGITLVKGKFPDNDVTQIFAPGDKGRLVKVNTPQFQGRGRAEEIYIKVPSSSQNRAKKRLYMVQIYFCPSGQETPRGYNTITVSDGGLLSITLANGSDPFGGGANVLTARGYLTYSSGAPTWDNKRERSSSLEVDREENNFKASFSISEDDLLTQKFRNSFGERLSKVYSISRFSGTSTSDVSFLEGAYTGLDQFGAASHEYSGATEFRASYYAAAPANSLVDDVAAIDIPTDSFFGSEAEVEVDTSSLSCTAKSDIELTMNGDNDTLEAALQPCFKREFERIEFCRNDSTIQQALRNFRSVCSAGPGGGNGGPGGGAAAARQ